MDKRCGTCKWWQGEYDTKLVSVNMRTVPIPARKCHFPVPALPFFFEIDYYEIEWTTEGHGDNCATWEKVDG